MRTLIAFVVVFTITACRDYRPISSEETTMAGGSTAQLTVIDWNAPGETNILAGTPMATFMNFGFLRSGSVEIDKVVANFTCDSCRGRGLIDSLGNVRIASVFGNVYEPQYLDPNGSTTSQDVVFNGQFHGDKGETPILWLMPEILSTAANGNVITARIRADAANIIAVDASGSILTSNQIHHVASTDVLAEIENPEVVGYSITIVNPAVP